MKALTKQFLCVMLVVHIFVSSAICAMAADVVLPANVKTIKASQLVAPPYNLTAGDKLTLTSSRTTLKLDADLALKQLLTNGSLTIEGNGTLSVMHPEQFVFKNVGSGMLRVPTAVGVSNLTINSGNVVASSPLAAIFADNITINGGNIIAQGFETITSSYKFHMNGGNLTVSATNIGIHANDIKFSGGMATVSAKGTNLSTAIVAGTNNANPRLIINGGTLALEATDNAIKSFDSAIQIQTSMIVTEPIGWRQGLAPGYPNIHTVLSANGMPAKKVVIQANGAIPNTQATPVAGATLLDGFDATFYAALYPDVVAVFGTDSAALYEHYVKYGKKEGRFPNLTSVPTH